MQLKWYRKEQNIHCRVVASNWNDLMVIFLNTLITLHGMLDINSKLDYSWRRANLILDSISIVSLMNDSVVFWHVWHLRAMLMNHQVNPWEQISANKETTQTGMQTDRQTDRRPGSTWRYLLLIRMRVCNLCSLLVSVSGCSGCPDVF